jgi:predicted  nucleic acid-binding Zn-ribbon protein
MKRSVVFAAFLALMPFALAAQQARPATARTPAPTASDQVRAWYSELQQISVRLQGAHARALEDQQLRTQQAAFMRMVKEEMDRADPALAGLAERVQRLEGEARAAAERGDQARLQALEREFAQIQARFINVETAVLQLPAVASAAQAYEQALRRRMVTVEPQVDQLLARTRELQGLLQRALGQQAP